MADLPLPEIDDINRPYHDRLREGELTFQRCEAGHAWLPARRACPTCLSMSVRWEAASRLGRLKSWVVYHVAYHEAFRDRLPYNVSLVELDEGPRLITNVLAPSHVLAAEARVRLVIDRNEPVPLPRFEPC